MLVIQKRRGGHVHCVLLSSFVERRGKSKNGLCSAVVARTEVCLEQELQQRISGVLLNSTCPEPKLRQNMPGAALNKLHLESCSTEQIGTPTITLYHYS